MYLYGASGHAKVIIDILTATNQQVDGLVDDNQDISELSGYPVLHDFQGLSPFIISIGDCAVRKRIARMLLCEYCKAVHPLAVVSPKSEIGDGSVVMQGAVIQTGSRIGRHCIVNTGASVDHDCTVGDFCHIAPHATLCGSVQVGECTWIGASSVVKQGIRIGRNCMIGAGSVVVSDIPDGFVAYGNPCKVVKAINPDSQLSGSERIVGGVKHYPSAAWLHNLNDYAA